MRRVRASAVGAVRRRGSFVQVLSLGEENSVNALESSSLLEARSRFRSSEYLPSFSENPLFTLDKDTNLVVRQTLINSLSSYRGIQMKAN